VAVGEPYYEDYTTEDDVIGTYMFADKEFKSLVLPNTLKKIGDYAITYCGDNFRGLRIVLTPDGAKKVMR
jgi:hypothetical protein